MIPQALLLYNPQGVSMVDSEDWEWIVIWPNQAILTAVVTHFHAVHKVQPKGTRTVLLLLLLCIIEIILVMYTVLNNLTITIIENNKK